MSTLQLIVGIVIAWLVIGVFVAMCMCMAASMGDRQQRRALSRSYEEPEDWAWPARDDHRNAA